MRYSWWFSQTLAGIVAGLSLVVPSGFLYFQTTGSSASGDLVAGANSFSTAVVESVVDGDTLIVSIGGYSERVRLLGIDTPESVSTSTPKQCFGDEATLALKGLVSPGDTVQISADLERRDRYGRLLLYVYTTDGLFINQWLVASGFADVLFYEPNTAMESELTATRNLARSSSTGLWAHCDGPDQPLN